MGCCSQQQKKHDINIQKQFNNIKLQNQAQYPQLDLSSKPDDKNPIEIKEEKSSKYDSQEIVDKEEQGDTKPARSEPNMVNQ